MKTGTNYYLRVNPCEKCGLSKEEHHIGKLSAGWRFLFHIDMTRPDFSAWCNALSNPENRIFDEYGNEVGFEEFIELIRSHANEQAHTALNSKTDGECDYTEDEFS